MYFWIKETAFICPFHLHAFTNNVFQLAEISQVVQSTCEQYLLQFYTYNNTSRIYIYIYNYIYNIFITFEFQQKQKL